ncbi:hypothetical protein CBW65_23705 [Tumebacillus avium]|uniref:Uncharacterized protein n=1 Tax=Tumebacillus avium TaxID=1903704 RepID=A0A1Y0IT43_9BACL|nr:hypothetical protein [Tumebacillus avium]ARU63691.1 hypothetical protein CBW65_23705 [Tumebacillus avium]
MYENKIYIAPNYTLDECKQLFFNLTVSSDNDTWEEALEIFSDRMDARFFDAIQLLLEQCHRKGQQWQHNLSFSIMALNCLLIETLQQFYEGLESTPSRRNQDAFRKFLRRSVHFNFPRAIADQFYGKIRCGILHQAETKDNVALSFTNFGPMVEYTEHGWLVFNVNYVTEALIKEYVDYCNRLRLSSETELRQNFINKMIYITTKANSQNAQVFPRRP